MRFSNVGRALPQMFHAREEVVELWCTSRPSGLHLGVLRPAATHHIVPVDRRKETGAWKA